MANISMKRMLHLQQFFFLIYDSELLGSGILETGEYIVWRKLGLFLSLGEGEDPYSVGSLRKS
jgi:hypothetical protein